MSRIAMRSSTIRMPTTSSRSGPRMPCSSNAFAMIVVLEIATIAPANRLSIVVQPNHCPHRKPIQTIRLDWSSAVRLAVGPSPSSLLGLNSSPSENISRMTPSSESVWMICRSANSGNGTFGPTRKPARM